MGQRWALWPALGMLVPLAAEPLRGVLAHGFPLALILVGGYLLWQGLAVGKGRT